MVLVFFPEIFIASCATASCTSDGCWKPTGVFLDFLGIGGNADYCTVSVSFLCITQRVGDDDYDDGESTEWRKMKNITPRMCKGSGKGEKGYIQ